MTAFCRASTKLYSVWLLVKEVGCSARPGADSLTVTTGELTAWLLNTVLIKKFLYAFPPASL